MITLVTKDFAILCWKPHKGRRKYFHENSNESLQVPTLNLSYLFFNQKKKYLGSRKICNF